VAEQELNVVIVEEEVLHGCQPVLEMNASIRAAQ
jgi:hypothetical protein